MLKARLVGIVFAGFMLVLAATAAAQVSREEFEALKSEVQGLREAVKTQTDVLRQFLERAAALRDGQEGPSKLTLGLGRHAVLRKGGRQSHHRGVLRLSVSLLRPVFVADVPADRA
jgi:hypothetical protein